MKIVGSTLSQKYDNQEEKQASIFGCPHSHFGRRGHLGMIQDSLKRGGGGGTVVTFTKRGTKGVCVWGGGGGRSPPFQVPGQNHPVYRYLPQ